MVFPLYVEVVVSGIGDIATPARPLLKFGRGAEPLLGPDELEFIRLAYNLVERDLGKSMLALLMTIKKGCATPWRERNRLKTHLLAAIDTLVPQTTS